jgi:pimeloyl-ACP methyl ester carboxylesterase
VSEGYRELLVAAGDGLRLFARDYGPLTGGALPVVCLPGLSRNSRDFHDLAPALARDPERPRRVLALDHRGRGRSAYDRDPERYDVKVELDDCLAVLAAAGVHEAVLVGTSRGGIITMALSAARPALIRGAVLNDVGPVIDPRGLVRIRGYLGKLPAPRSWAQGAEILKGVQGAAFPALDDGDWEEMARGTWREEAGRLVPDHDPALARTLDGVDLETPLPSFWPLFEGLEERARAGAARSPLGHPVGGHPQGHGPGPSGARGRHGARPGPRPDAARQGDDRPHPRLRAAGGRDGAGERGVGLGPPGHVLPPLPLRERVALA